MARLFIVAISEANYNNTEEQIWLLNNICSRIKSLTTVSHSVRSDTYSGYSEMIELLVQVLDASTLNSYSGPRYQEIGEALNALLTMYESHLPEQRIERARKSYGNINLEFEKELAEIEESINPDGELSDERVSRFFHRDGKRETVLRRAQLIKRLEERKSGKQ